MPRRLENRRNSRLESLRYRRCRIELEAALLHRAHVGCLPDGSAKAESRSPKADCARPPLGVALHRPGWLRPGTVRPEAGTAAAAGGSDFGFRIFFGLRASDLARLYRDPAADAPADTAAAQARITLFSQRKGRASRGSTARAGREVQRVETEVRSLSHCQSDCCPAGMVKRAVLWFGTLVEPFFHLWTSECPSPKAMPQPIAW